MEAQIVHTTAVQSDAAQPGLGGGYHLDPNTQRLAVSGGGAGPVCTQGRGLGDGARHAGYAGVQGTATDHRSTPTGARVDRAFGPRQFLSADLLPEFTL